MPIVNQAGPATAVVDTCVTNGMMTALSNPTAFPNPTHTFPTNAFFALQFIGAPDQGIRRLMLDWTVAVDSNDATAGYSAEGMQINIFRADDPVPIASCIAGARCFDSLPQPLGRPYSADIISTFDNINRYAVRLDVGCRREDSTTHCVADRQNPIGITVRRAEVVLYEQSPQPPTASAITGGLATDQTLTGTEQLSFDAVDNSAGVYRALVRVNGGPLQPLSLAGMPGACADLLPTSGTPYEFADPRACPTSGAFSIGLDTRQLPDGPATIDVLLEDAQGERSTILSRSGVRVDNAPSPPPASPALGSSAPQTATEPCAMCITAPAAPPKAGVEPSAINGTGGTPTTARFTSVSRRTIRVRWDERRTVVGRIVDADGVPITNAVVDVLDDKQTVASVVTNSGGYYRYRLDKGVSRSIRFGYRSTFGASFYRDTATVRVRVKGKIRVSPTRKSLSPGGRLRLRGQLLGGRAGTQMQVQARDGHRWRTIDVVETRKGGRISWAYRFKRTLRATFVFRLKMTNSARSRLDATNSNPITVHVG